MKKSLLTNMIVLISATVLIFAGCAMLSKPTPKSTAKSVAPMQTIDGRNYCSSSQVFYKGKRFTLTNAHCCEAAPIPQVDGSYSVSVKGSLKKILYVSPVNDVCIVEPTEGKPLGVATGETYPGDTVYIMGYPYGTGPVFEAGKIVSKYDIAMVGFLQFFIVDIIDTYTFPGNSGSPVLNKYGQLIGLVFAGDNQFPFMGAIVPLKLLKKDLDIYVKNSK